MSNEPVEAGVTLTTAQLEQVIAEWMANAKGLALPVKHTARWGWVPGQGPVLIRMDIETVANVVPLRKGRSGG
jgi:hypothetical protein